MIRKVFPTVSSRTEIYCDKCGHIITKGHSDGGGGTQGSGMVLKVRKWPDHLYRDKTVTKQLCLRCGEEEQTRASLWNAKPRLIPISVNEQAEEVEGEGEIE